MHLYKQYPEAVVIIFPSDHFILEENLFLGHVDLACRVVERDPSRMVLLGLEPDGPEPEYGYILPDPAEDAQQLSVVRKVMRFIEKPEPQAVQDLICKGGLWNTMVMAFQARALLSLISKILPGMYRAFQRIREVIGFPMERKVVHEAYQDLDPVNFSKGILQVVSSRYPSRLSVLPVRGVLWSDWGSEKRILNALEKNDLITRFHQTYGPCVQ
jgi:mannose-1-phosphate guanylyltransferase